MEEALANQVMEKESLVDQDIVCYEKVSHAVYKKFYKRNIKSKFYQVISGVEMDNIIFEDPFCHELEEEHKMHDIEIDRLLEGASPK